MRTAVPLILVVVTLTACASRNRAADGDLSHDPETCTVDGHNHAAEILAGTQAEAEDAARDAAWHAGERTRSGAERSKPRTAQPSDPKQDDRKEDAPDTPQPRKPPPR